jgi:hypothetical protein
MKLKAFFGIDKIGKPAWREHKYLPNIWNVRGDLLQHLSILK